MDKSDLKKIYEDEPEALDIIELIDCSSDEEFKKKLMTILKNIEDVGNNVY